MERTTGRTPRQNERAITSIVNHYVTAEKFVLRLGFLDLDEKIEENGGKVYTWLNAESAAPFYRSAFYTKTTPASVEMRHYYYRIEIYYTI